MYIHEEALHRAMAKLYKLGGPGGETSEPSSGGQFGAAIGHAVRHAKTGPRPMSETDKSESMKGAIMQSAIQNAQKQRDAMDLERYNTMAAAPGRQDLQRAQQNLQTNDLAEQTRMGGRFTPQGLENADAQAQANGADRLRARAMIGIGGTNVPSWENY
jgi:hypothetical protein